MKKEINGFSTKEILDLIKPRKKLSFDELNDLLPDNFDANYLDEVYDLLEDSGIELEDDSYDDGENDKDSDSSSDDDLDAADYQPEQEPDLEDIENIDSLTDDDEDIVEIDDDIRPDDAIAKLGEMRQMSTGIDDMETLENPDIETEESEDEDLDVYSDEDSQSDSANESDSDISSSSGMVTSSKDISANDDPIRLYLHETGKEPLLNGEEEGALAREMEKGAEMILHVIKSSGMIIDRFNQLLIRISERQSHLDDNTKKNDDHEDLKKHHLMLSEYLFPRIFLKY